MREKEATEKQIDDTLTKIMESDYQNKTLKFLAKILFNVRYDLNELKLELVKCLGDIGIDAEINHKPEEEDGRFYS